MQIRETNGERTIDTTNKEQAPLPSHKDEYLDIQEKTKKMFLCHQTMIKDCDHMVTLYQKSPQRKFCLIQSSIS